MAVKHYFWIRSPLLYPIELQGLKGLAKIPPLGCHIIGLEKLTARAPEGLVYSNRKLHNTTIEGRRIRLSEDGGEVDRLFRLLMGE